METNPKESRNVADIAKARELSGWLNQQMRGLTFEYEHRLGFASACFSLAFEHHDAIILLFERRMAGSAFSLVRPAFETYIRGVWLLQCAKDSQIEQFAKGRCDPSVEKMISDLEGQGYTAGGELSKSWKGKKRLHDFTHGGFLHLQRRFQPPDGIGANYPDEDVITVLGFVNAIVLMCMEAQARVCKDRHLQMAVLEKAKEYA